MKTLLLQTARQASALISEGKLVAFPTETVYGLGASVFDEEGIRAIFVAKGRPSDNPLIVHVSSLHQVEALAEEIPALFYVLAEIFWPGPLTFVLKKQPCISSLVSGGLDSIAIRMPSHPLAIQLIEEVGAPLVAPSANLSGRPSPTQALHVLEDLDGAIAAVLDGGECSLGVESTVISLLEDKIVLLRPGSITKEQIEEISGRAVLSCSQDSAVRSPGMKYRHYAPNCPIILVETREEIEKALAEKTGKWMVLVPTIELPKSANHTTPLLDNFNPGALACSDDEGLVGKTTSNTFLLSSHTLYALLRKADKEGYAGIVVLYDAEIRKDEALVNRLLKASLRS